MAFGFSFLSNSQILKLFRSVWLNLFEICSTTVCWSGKADQHLHNNTHIKHRDYIKYMGMLEILKYKTSAKTNLKDKEINFVWCITVIWSNWESHEESKSFTASGHLTLWIQVPKRMNKATLMGIIKVGLWQIATSNQRKMSLWVKWMFPAFYFCEIKCETFEIIFFLSISYVFVKIHPFLHSGLQHT